MRDDIALWHCLSLALPIPWIIPARDYNVPLNFRYKSITPPIDSVQCIMLLYQVYQHGLQGEFQQWQWAIYNSWEHINEASHLTHSGQDKMATILQRTFPNWSSWIKIVIFSFQFHWKLFPRVLLTICIGSDNGLAPNRRQAMKV